MRSSLACRLFSCSVLGAALLVAGCGTDQETGLLALSISPDPTNPPMPASKIVLAGPGFTRTYTGPFPRGGDAGATLVLEYPNLPASSSPVALTVQAYDSNGCQVGAASVPVSVTIQAGVKNGPFPVTLAAVAACGDGGILRASQDSGAGAAEAGGLDARADGPPTGDAAADKPADASAPSSGAEVSDGGRDTGTGGTTGSGDAWVADAPDGQPDVPIGGADGGAAGGSSGSGDARVADAPDGQRDVPIGGSGGSIGTAGTTAVGGTTGSGGATNTGGTSAAGGTTGSGGATNTGGTSTMGGTTGSGGTTNTGGTSAAGGTTGSGGATNTGGTSAAGGTTGSGGATNTGGTTAVGGTTGSGGVGTGGTTAVCQESTTQCSSSTSVQTCASGQWGAAVACPTGLVCERSGTATCADPNWDEWPIPNSQVDVTAGAPNIEGYTDNGDGTVTDNVTGLMWQQAVATTTNDAGTQYAYTWAQAVAYCPTLTLAGHSDWRLPSQIELQSIVDFGQSNPSINGTYFPSTPSNYFWSSSPVAGSPSIAWSVDFGDGSSGYNLITSTYDVRCVR